MLTSTNRRKPAPAITTFEKGYGSDCTYYFSISDLQPVEDKGFIPVSQYCFSRALIKRILDENGATEIPNPDPEFQA